MVGYCSVDDVSDFLSFSFSSSSKPSSTHIQNLINRVSAEINRITGTAFADTPIDLPQIPDYEYHNIEFAYYWLTGVPIYLYRRPIVFLSGDGGDAIEVYNGSDYEDWLNNRTEGRNGDWWVNYQLGILFLRNFVWLRRPFAVRVLYHYGIVPIPEDIKQACIYKVASLVLSGEDRSVLLPEGTSNLQYKDKLEHWIEEYEKIVERYREFRVIGVTKF